MLGSDAKGISVMLATGMNENYLIFILLSEGLVVLLVEFPPSLSQNFQLLTAESWIIITKKSR